ncbi:hypothetical protein Zm00014a_006090 [Zea mays]|jgi:hypothetical protein|uniref:Uncharacterized protein n=2 Tax=Zea mays TaxID=4577 RepID=B6U0P8_MAIZE|nr:uncharacterized protein LOC100277850 [Zea mays]ACG42931.1 hypothetical protein [Zea mays]AQK58608.1 hypothetical protein ZEAMMB73_Zm00001d053042 [Zea mays]PWZ26513.1 hypothetical protein Zm00014a_006090 [Zea mays]|eukprot:NP_001144783.1 uncharacterized protein LOC100277850 [Zea mays]
MGAASRRAAPAPAWRSSCLALCLLPVALPLLLLCLPLLCVVVAFARFRRRRRRLLVTAAKSRSCCPGERSLHEAEGHRAALLHKYLEDQMELVAGDAVAVDPTPSSQRSHPHQKQQ